VQRQSAKAPNPEAEEAIPLECGNVFIVFISIKKPGKKGNKCSTLLKNCSSFGSNEGIGLPSKENESKSVPSSCLGSYFKFVIV